MNYSKHLADDELATNEQIEYAQKNLHTSIPCRVISFNSNEQTVSLEVLIQKKMVDGASENYPPLYNVPISYPRGGGFCFTFPLSKGDEGLAIFSERCIDKWWLSGEPSIPIDYRLHDLSDACFIPGVCSKPKVVKGFFDSGLSMQNISGDTFIRITNGTIFIKGDIHQEGGINSTNDIVSGSISLQQHTHGGVKAGDSNTGVPQ